MKVAVVETETAVGEGLVGQLNANGHQARRIRHGTDLLLSHGNYDVAVLDTELPDQYGISLLRRLRKVSALPVVVLAADPDERAVVRTLQSGADDYMMKPPRLGELQARLEAVTRRTVVALSTLPEPVVVSRDVRIDLAARSVEVAGAPIALTRKEFELVRVLVQHLGAAVSREQLMDRIWGDTFEATSRVLDVHMATLRAKLSRPGLIKTLRGHGYRWEDGELSA